MEKVKADRARLYKDVEVLTGIEPARNYANMASLAQASEYIFSELEKLGWKTEYQYFNVDGREYRNVIASYNSAKKERIIIGAHYDVCGDQPGADDNASGIAGLLETARMINEQQPKLGYRLDFVAYCLEEPPYFTTEKMGSAVHAKHLHDNNIQVRAMICYEMIGYFSDEPHSQNFPDISYRDMYPTTGNFIIVLGREGEEDLIQEVKQHMRSASSLGVETIILPAQHPLAGLSDHRSYWKYGYKAVMIDDTSFLRNPHYHEKSDTIDTLDFSRMAEVVTGVYHAVTNL